MRGPIADQWCLDSRAGFRPIPYYCRVGARPSPITGSGCSMPQTSNLQYASSNSLFEGVDTSREVRTLSGASPRLKATELVRVDVAATRGRVGFCMGFSSTCSFTPMYAPLGAADTSNSTVCEFRALIANGELVTSLRDGSVQRLIEAQFLLDAVGAIRVRVRVVAPVSRPHPRGLRLLLDLRTG